MKLEILNLHKSFGAKKVLDGINFEAESGTPLGLLGRNGAGKTTTIRILLSVFNGDMGEVLVDGVKIDKSDAKIGYLPEERGLFPRIKIIDQMVYIGRLKGMGKKEAEESAKLLLGELGALEYADKKIETLSKGNQQKIQLAVAVIHNPDIVILDEPFSGLDPVNSIVLKKLITRLKNENKIVIFSSHEMGYVEEFCSKVAIIHGGKIIENSQIDKIKDKYPKNKILIKPENFKKFEEKINLFSNKEKLEKNGENFIITLKEEKNKEQLLDYLSKEELFFKKFEVVVPSLEEIFIEKVGGKNE